MATVTAVTSTADITTAAAQIANPCDVLNAYSNFSKRRRVNQIGYPKVFYGTGNSRPRNVLHIKVYAITINDDCNYFWGRKSDLAVSEFNMKYLAYMDYN